VVCDGATPGCAMRGPARQLARAHALVVAIMSLVICVTYGNTLHTPATRSSTARDTARVAHMHTQRVSSNLVDLAETASHHLGTQVRAPPC
jgi:hypothetical protein